MTDIKKELELTPEETMELIIDWEMLPKHEHTHFNLARYITQSQSDKIFNDPRVVVLDEDQSLPTNPFDCMIAETSGEEGEYYTGKSNGFEKGMSAMLKAGFKRVRRMAQHGL